MEAEQANIALVEGGLAKTQQLTDRCVPILVLPLPRCCCFQSPDPTHCELFVSANHDFTRILFISNMRAQVTGNYAARRALDFGVSMFLFCLRSDCVHHPPSNPRRSMLSILNSFERRLATLETSMVPIHQKTLGLTVASRSASHFSRTGHSAYQHSAF